jgi:hypothetical protein
MEYSPNFWTVADLNVSAELLALRKEVDKTIGGKFQKDVETLESLSQQRQLEVKRMSQSGSHDDSVVMEENILSERIYKLERDFNIELNRILERIDHLMTYVKHNSRRIDDLEQESRLSTLIFQGVSESETKPPDYQIMDIMRNKMGLFIPNYPCPENGSGVEPGELVPPFVISRAFRLGKPRTTAEIAEMGPRPIMVRFGSLFIRDKVFRERKSLRGSKRYVSPLLDLVMSYCNVHVKR